MKVKILLILAFCVMFCMNVYGVTTEEVLFHHLQANQSGDVDAIMSDYADNALLFTVDTVLKGHDEIRQFFTMLATSSPSSGTSFEVLKSAIEGEIAYMVWSMDSPFFSIPFGSDTFVIRDGKIISQIFTSRTIPKFGPVASTKIRFELTESPEKDTLMSRLQAISDNDIDTLMSCYTEDAVYIMPDGTLHGRDMIKAYYSAGLGNRTSKGLPFNLLQAVVSREFGYIVWSSESADLSIPIGTDAFVFRDGKIAAQTLAMQTAPGFENTFSISLQPGLNMISLPLKPSVPYTARSLAEKLSANVVIRYDETLRRFMGFDVKVPGDGFPIEGGKGYIVNVPAGGTFTFAGSAWTNKAPFNIQNNNSWAFVVSGSIINDNELEVSGKNYTAIVKNLETGLSVMETINSSGYFTVAYADLARRSVVNVGDDLRITVLDDNGTLVSGPYVYRVGFDDVRNAVMRVQLHLGNIIPTKSELLQNYPNPFNPETWIPFQLSEDSNVRVRVYDMQGKMVRSLDLGKQSAGIYLSKNKAVYWDGRNDAGEIVVSGMYFYQLQTDKYSSIKKMIIKK